jgi:hypothetical protein
VLIGWQAKVRRASGRHLRIGVFAVGATATVLMGIVGCTSITAGTPAADTHMAPAYRSSVSASVSASSATSRTRESQRQQSLTTQAVLNACESFVNSANDAIDKMNTYTQALNVGGNTAPFEGPAKDALSHTAAVIADNIGGPLSPQLRDALNGYADAARDVAKLIGPNPSTSAFNAAVNRFNDRLKDARRACRASL